MVPVSFLRRATRKHIRQVILLLLMWIVVLGTGAITFKKFNNPSKSINNDNSFVCSDYNVVLIAVDALRADHLGVYDYPRATSPQIDSLTQHSLVFDQAITQASWTLPSFLSIFTSLYPTSIHPDTLEIPQDKLKADMFLIKVYPRLVNITELSKQNSYVTAAFTAGGYMVPISIGIGDSILMKRFVTFDRRKILRRS